MQNDTPTYPNWFESQRHNFENNLSYLKGQPNLKFLQLGVFTGDASLWLLENVLTHPSARLTDVDTWQGSDEDEHKSMNFDDVFEVYKKKLMPYYDRILAIKSDTDTALTDDLNYTGNYFDFIYIDGDHTSHQVAKDADNAWKLLKSGGILAFDDYLWGQDLPPELTPKPAIDRFLAKYTGEYDLLSQDYQLWLKKK